MFQIQDSMTTSGETDWWTVTQPDGASEHDNFSFMNQRNDNFQNKNKYGGKAVDLVPMMIIFKTNSVTR